MDHENDALPVITMADIHEHDQVIVMQVRAEASVTHADGTTDTEDE